MWVNLVSINWHFSAQSWHNVQSLGLWWVAWASLSLWKTCRTETWFCSATSSQANLRVSICISWVAVWLLIAAIKWGLSSEWAFWSSGFNSVSLKRPNCSVPFSFAVVESLAAFGLFRLHFYKTPFFVHRSNLWSHAASSIQVSTSCWVCVCVMWCCCIVLSTHLLSTHPTHAGTTK